MIDLGILKDLGKMRQLRKQLANQRVEVEENGVKVVVSGDQKIKQLQWVDSVSPETVKRVINKAYDQLRRQVARGMMKQT